MQCGKCGGENIEGSAVLRVVRSETFGGRACGRGGVPMRGGAGNGTDAQGFCGQCGRRVVSLTRTPLPRDHVEIELSPAFASVTDRGRKHDRNEDACVIFREDANGKPVSLLIVCDGVSSSQDADTASETAANAALETLKQAAQAPDLNPESALHDALLAAHRAVCKLPHTALTGKDPPLTTIVAALVLAENATIGWIGDSRAYLVAGDEIRQLTKDHSWQNMVVDAGELTPEEAAAGAAGSRDYAMPRLVGGRDAGGFADAGNSVGRAVRRLAPDALHGRPLELRADAGSAGGAARRRAGK